MTGFLTRFFVRHPKVAGIFGLVFALLFGALAIASLRDVNRMPSSPQSVSISDATALAASANGQQLWVRIEDALLDCDTLIYRRVGSNTRTDILVTDEPMTDVVVAEFSGRLTCEQLLQRDLSGMLSKMSDRRYQQFRKLNEFDLADYPSDAAFMDLCAYCGRSNSQLGVVVGAVLAVVSLSIYPLVLREHRKVYPPTANR